MLFNFHPILSSSEKILSLVLTLYIHLTILASFLSILITTSSLTGQVPLPYSKKLHTDAEQNLPFNSKGSTGTKFLNLSTPDSCYSTFKGTPSSNCVTKITKSCSNFQRLVIKIYIRKILCHVCLLICTCLALKPATLFQFT